MKKLVRHARHWAFISVLLVARPVFAQDVIVLEAEDFNYDGGQFVENAALGDYAGAGASQGTPNIDFKENTPGTRLGNEATDGYRAPAVGSPGLPQTVLSGDAPRAEYTAASLNEYDLSSVAAGEWVNYTRVFPAGDYTVRARVRATEDPEAFIARLERVTTNAAEPNQSATAIGAFLGRNATREYGFLSLTDVTGSPVTVSLDGTETLRVATQIGSYDLNYLEFTPSNTATPMPTIRITEPANEIGVQPGEDLKVVVDVGDPGAVAAVQLLANSFEGEEITVGELAEPPFEFLWEGVPAGSYRLLGIVAGTNGLIGLSSEITVFSDGTPPELQQARGRTIEDVVLTFSEAMNQATAGDPANYTIVDADGNALAVTGVTVELDGRVFVGTAEQSVGKNYTVTTRNLTDLAGNALAGEPSAEFFGNGPLLQTDLGFVVFEAEHYDRNLDGIWIEDTERGTPTGGVSMVSPNGAGGGETETQLEYDIKFVKTGTHYLWYRASGDNGNDDSAWLWVDGARPVGREEGNRAAMTGFSNQPDFVWRSQAFEGGDTMSFDINSAGLHTIALARREDGSFFDKFVITTDPNFDPTALGEEGPGLTPREGEEVAAGSVQVTLNPENVSGDEHGFIELLADGSGSEGFIILFQWQRKEGDVFVDIPDATLTNLTFPRASLDWDGAVVRFTVRTEGAEAVSSEATITVNPETIAPELVSASGQGQRVVLQFSERLAEATTQDLGNYTISDGGAALAINSATFLPSERAVILDTAPQTVGTKYTVTVNGITDQAAAPNSIADSEAKFYSLGALLPQGEDGLIVFEAESYTEILDDRWIEDSEWGNPSGGLSMVLPNGAGGNEDSKIEYELTFTQTGEHIIWYRASGPTGTDDSGWLHINGARPDNRLDANQASMTGFSNQVDFVWRSQPQDGGGQMTFEIAEPGVYTIGLARREDGSYFDKFAITTNPDFDPEAFGPLGPAETREGAPPTPTLTISSPATVAEGGDVVVTPDISETTRVITKVEYFADGEKIGEATQSPFTFTWSRAPSGFHSIQAVLLDDVGARVLAGPIDVTVEGDIGGGGVPTVDGDGRTVVWVSQVDSPAGKEFLDFLAGSSFGVTEVYVEDPTEAEKATLNAADVVVLSRKTASGNYNLEVWDTEITAPLILMTPYLSRANRWAWLAGDGLVDATPESIVADLPGHPIFQSVVLTDGVSEAWHTPVDRGTSIATDPIANGGTVIASADGNMIVAEWPAGAVAAGPRMLFSAGSREPADPADIAEAGKFNLTPSGGQAFLNAILYMADLEAQPPMGDLSIGVARTAGGINITLSGAAAFDVEYSSALDPGSWTVIATDVTEFEDTDAARVQTATGFYRGVAK